MVKLIIFCEDIESGNITNSLKTNKIKSMIIRHIKENPRMSGERLTEIRKTLNMTQKNFADNVVAIDQAALSRMEAGLTKVSDAVADAALTALTEKERKLAEKR